MKIELYFLNTYDDSFLEKELKSKSFPAGENNFYYFDPDYESNKDYIRKTINNFFNLLIRYDMYNLLHGIDTIKNKRITQFYYKFLTEENCIYKPKSNEEFKKVIRGYFKFISNSNDLTLNWIDTSKITDMHGLFEDIRTRVHVDIDKWDVSNVRDMRNMFHDSSIMANTNKWEVYPYVKTNYNTWVWSNISDAFRFKTPCSLWKLYFLFLHYIKKFTN